MSRYGNMTCEEFVRNSKTINPDDPIYVKCNNLELAEKEIAVIRKQRYDYITINETLQVVVTNQISFDDNIAQESKIMKDLSQLISLFNQLNPFFGKIQIDLPRLTEPTLTGLRRLKTDYKHLNSSIMQRIKNEAADRLKSRGFQSGAASMQQILDSPDFKRFAEAQENQIAANDLIIEKINNYIGEIEHIIIEIFGEE